MKKLISFLFSKKYLFNIIAILIVWIVVVVGVQIYLKNSTNFGQKIEVPSLYKVHIDDVSELINSRDLKFEIIDSIYVDGWPKGTVCWQYPRPTDSTKEYVKSGRLIQVSIVPNKPKLVKIPLVVDRSKRMAESMLESMGFRTRIIYKPSNEGSGYVMAQKMKGKEIKGGEFAKKGSIIELIVAKGNGGETTALPNLIGLTINEARERLSNLAVSLHEQCPNCNSESEIGLAIIKSQSPNGGEGVLIAAGTTVTVWAEK